VTCWQQCKHITFYHRLQQKTQLTLHTVNCLLTLCILYVILLFFLLARIINKCYNGCLHLGCVLLGCLVRKTQQCSYNMMWQMKCNCRNWIQPIMQTSVMIQDKFFSLTARHSHGKHKENTNEKQQEHTTDHANLRQCSASNFVGLNMPSFSVT